MQEQVAVQTDVRPPLFSGSALRRLIIPLVIEQFLAMTIGMADTMMVTSVGEHAVSGVSLVDNISILLINIFSALATGARWWPRNTWGPGMSPMPALPPSSFFMPLRLSPLL